MAASSAVASSMRLGSPFPAGGLVVDNRIQSPLITHHHKRASSPFRFRAAAKLPPAGLEFPKAEPKFNPPLLGFTKTAEVWNSRACMIGLIGTFFVELIIHKGILQVIGVEVGKGLDIPL